MDLDSRVREALAVRAGARELASAAKIAATVDRLAAEIGRAFERGSPVLLAVMTGGVFLATELSRRLELPHELDYVHLSRYGRALEGGQIEWHVRPHARLRGRDVLIVDDILDRGETLAALRDELVAIGVASIRIVVLVVKQLAEPRERPPVDFVGLSVDDHYVFGCGMDYKGFWRGLPALYAAD